MKQIISRTLILAAFALCAVTIFSAEVNAATYTVDTTADNAALTACAAAADDCSLRGAIARANASAQNDTINFSIPAGSAGCTANNVCTITLAGSELIITKATGTLTITNSTGAGNLLISGNNQSRVFQITQNANLYLEGITVTKGFKITADSTGTGGGIFNDGGTVTLTNLIVSGNSAKSGGGIRSSGGSLTVTNSSISGNFVTGNGGGIYNNGLLTLINSTVTENVSSVQAGGIENYTGTLTVTNSTVSRNSAGASGGGIVNWGSTTIIKSTISENVAQAGGGIYHNFGDLNLSGVTVAFNRANFAQSLGCSHCPAGVFALRESAINLNNTIVAKNTVANEGDPPDIYALVSSSSSYNLIGNNDGLYGITDGVNNNQIGTPTNPLDPLLGILANNGGATQTHALLFESPAIDKGSDTGTDQRGLSRPIDLGNYTNADNGADIGAYEMQLPTAASVTIGGRVLTPKNRRLINALIVLTEQNGATRYARTSIGGHYQFTDITAGSTVIIEVLSKQYRFAPRVVTVTSENMETDFYAVSP